MYAKFIFLKYSDNHDIAELLLKVALNTTTDVKIIQLIYPNS